MNHLPLTARLIAAFSAAATTLVLFSAVIANSEPQRSVLIAKTQRAEKLAARAAGPAVIALANDVAAKDVK